MNDRKRRKHTESIVLLSVSGVICFTHLKKGFLKNMFGVLSTAFLVTVLSVLVSVPLNFALMDGATGNIWGDGVAGLL